MAEHSQAAARHEASNPNDVVGQRTPVDDQRCEVERARWIARMNHPAMALLG